MLYSKYIYKFGMYTIVGLGNPGEEYVTTRHNVAWLVLEQFVGAQAFSSFSNSSLYSANLSEGRIENTPVTVLLPSTFMNNSGVAVAKFVRDRGTLDTLVVVHDDVDIPFGEVRVAYDRGAGGHNGIKSIIDSCGSTAFIRVRVGIARKGIFGGVKRPTGEALSHFVLGRFTTSELKALKEVGERVHTALTLIVTKGKEEAMQVVNKG